ncbi:type IV pilin protein [Massilia endophytica]|uniref:type IV pilin protein n=1 Tax=Massilia endophytica TaxID=2899220 RepID=UPI001E62DAF4|nr:type IV pilin protein [Massilia endophytica]UGQ47794.1 type IV pilin protein [Massilia endophytica]
MRRAHGASALELMTVLVITGVLSAVALPSYQEQVLRARRSEAQAMLLALMQQQERYASQHNRYIAFSADSSDADARQFRWHSGPVARRSAYEIEGRACAGEDIADCIELVATPGTARVDPAFRDPLCGKLILTSNGEQKVSGQGERCWR